MRAQIQITATTAFAAKHHAGCMPLGTEVWDAWSVLELECCQALQHGDMQSMQGEGEINEQRTYGGNPAGQAGGHNLLIRLLGAARKALPNVAHLGGGVQLVKDDPGVVGADVLLRLLQQLETCMSPSQHGCTSWFVLCMHVLPPCTAAEHSQCL